MKKTAKTTHTENMTQSWPGKNFLAGGSPPLINKILARRISAASTKLPQG